MNKPETIAEAKKVGIVRTEKQFDEISKGDLQKVIDEYNAMTPEQKEQANKDAEEADEKSGSEAGDVVAESKEKTEKSSSKKDTESATRLANALKDLKKNYPEAKEVFSTTDGTVFFKETHAKLHQVSALKGKASDVIKHSLK